MKDKQKKTFELPTEANTDGEMQVSTGLQTNNPFNAEDNFAGDSVDEHKKLEAANEYLGKKQISQVNNNS